MNCKAAAPSVVIFDWIIDYTFSLGRKQSAISRWTCLKAVYKYWKAPEDP